MGGLPPRQNLGHGTPGRQPGVSQGVCSGAESEGAVHALIVSAVAVRAFVLCGGVGPGCGVMGVAKTVSWCHGVNARSHLPQEAVARRPGRARVAQYRSKCNTLCDAPRSPSPLPRTVIAHATRHGQLQGRPHSRAPMQVPLHTGPPMYSILSKVINFAWAHTQCLQFCEKQ